MKHLISGFLFALSITMYGQIDTSNIQILRFDQHPFLIDHSRLLITIDHHGDTVDREILYGDSGIGCNSHLFATDTSFIFIDCNGHWFEIDKESGEISVIGWQWLEDLPDKYIGTYMRGQVNQPYGLIVEDILTLEKVYKLKDPK